MVGSGGHISVVDLFIWKCTTPDDWPCL